MKYKNNTQNEEQMNKQTPIRQSLNERSQEPQATDLLKLTWKFAIGFLGWYLVMAFVFWVALGYTFDAQKMNYYDAPIILNGMCIFPTQILTLIVLFLVKSLREVGFGMFSAIGVNLVISIFMGMFSNPLCFIPFFIRIMD
jgi:hypothetical protein